MSDEPRDGTADGADLGRDDPTRDPSTQSVADVDPSVAPDPVNDVSAPWERPRHWSQAPLDATRVDDLLARLGTPDDAPAEGRRRRRATDDAVPARELIASLAANHDAPEARVVADQPVATIGHG